MPPPRQGHTKRNLQQPSPIRKLGVEARLTQMRRPQPSKRQRCLPLPYLILHQVNRHINLKAKGKISTIRTLSFDQASLSNMGSEGSHNTQNDTPLAPGAKQQKNKQKKFALQAKVDELEA
ncbi:hypothetical protein ACFXTH_045810 [Malus domestica]